MKIKIICEFSIEDVRLRCPVPVLLDLDAKDDSYTWLDPFSMDGLPLNSTLEISFAILTRHQHTVPLFAIEYPLQQLSFRKQRYFLKHKRFSIHNRSTTHPTIDEQINCVHVNGVDIGYVADRYADLIRFKITSIHTQISKEVLQRHLSRDKLRVTLALNKEHFLYKANSVFLQQNNTKVFSWIFDPESTVLQNNIQISNRERYDCDADNDESNNPIRVYTPQVDSEHLLLEFTRDVFFPLGETGYASKTLGVQLSQLDFEARIQRSRVLASATTTETLFTLERGLRQDIALKLQYDADLFIMRIDLVVDNYPDAINAHFL